MKSYYIIAGAIIIAFVVLGASSFMSSMTPYVEDFAKVRASAGETLQVPGDIVKGKVEYDRSKPALVFYLKDGKGEELKVVYRGIRPANFGQADKAVALGKYRNGVFEADELRVKCPSKYQSK